MQLLASSPILCLCPLPFRGATELVAMYSSIVVNANDVVLVTEAEPTDAAAGGPKVLFVNPAFTRMTGYLPEETVGLTPRILQSPKTDQGQLDRLRSALRRWAPVEVELLNVRKDGTEFGLRSASPRSPITAAGSPTGSLSSAM